MSSPKGFPFEFWPRERQFPLLPNLVFVFPRQFSKSNSSQVTLTNLDFDATGSYYCEVSIDNPIFTKASNEVHLHVIGEFIWLDNKSFFTTRNVPTVKQTGPPKIMFKKKLFVVGENLIANCTTTRAKPHPHITWLINGKKVKRNKNCCASITTKIREKELAAIKTIRSARHDMQTPHTLTHKTIFNDHSRWERKRMSWIS